MTRQPIDYAAVWAATYATAWHHEYRRALETTDAADRHAAALLHGRERDCIDVADRAVDDLRRADGEHYFEPDSERG